ncbi:MAG TPA: hypothetical protein VNF47_02025 [Streptosporangiaceae bacterium]|nr:hypothetical protein [Streptosporangiaceae bacterium]
MSDIDAFTERVSGGEHFQDWSWDNDAEQERPWGDESWTGEMDDLFARAADLFLAGDMTAAGDAYGRLLDAFERDGEVGTFCGPAVAVDMVSADVGEAAHDHAPGTAVHRYRHRRLAGRDLVPRRPLEQ